MPRRAVSALLATTAALVGLGLPAVSPVADPAAAEGQRPAPRSAVPFPTRTAADRDGNTRLADDRGRILQLRGANLGKFDDITEQDVADLGAAGLSLLRLPIQWSLVEPTEGSYDAAYLQHVQDVLDWAHEAGLLVLVDWHQDVFGPAFGFDGAPAWATRTDGLEFEPVDGNWFNNYFHPAVQAAFSHLWNDADLQEAQVAAWTHVAAQLAGSPALLGYDLFNEPMWTSGTFETQELPAMYRRVIAGIRSVDARSWLWIEPTVLVGEGLPVRLPGIEDPRAGADRIGFAPHAYSSAVEDGGDWDATSIWVSAYEAQITQYPRRHHLPVIVGEWGPIAANADFPGNVELVEQQAASFPRFASGWAIWYGCRSATGGGYCIFTDDAGHLDPGRGAAWRPYALALAGRTVRETAGAHRFRLSYRPRPGTTTVIVPSGFATRPDVAVTTGTRAAPARVRMSAPTATGARTITVRPRHRPQGTWTLTISG
ncbi:glycoside hydrolase family 5 protein [Nocardioides mangrovi]|uniref:Glycoside hydrolase family 5 protein n=1 Tax=Nocardioides mangrovi TaxID=2874580 RepID=A0ABS7UD91_9ACTN|nr:cellulase family glycosylhydrolase [Nocardioides mangrovi]MBZ5738825.1 glycoside hydrolase family 5 protein [Nocardioides mangrovi]